MSNEPNFSNFILSSVSIPCNYLFWISIFFFFSMAEAPDLPFFIKRSKFNNLPVYTDYKRGGNYKLTVIRKIEGDLQVPK